MFPQHNAWIPYRESKVGVDEGVTQVSKVELTTRLPTYLPKHFVAWVPLYQAMKFFFFQMILSYLAADVKIGSSLYH